MAIILTSQLPLCTISVIREIVLPAFLLFLEDEGKSENYLWYNNPRACLVGLTFKNQSKYFKLGLIVLKKIIKNNFDDMEFPKSRNPEELMVFLKYLIIVKEWIKESQNNIPQYPLERI